MNDATSPETEKTRRLLATISLIALAVAGLMTAQAACRGKQGSEAPSAAAKSAPGAPQPTPTPDPGESPSFKPSAPSGQPPFSAVKAPFDVRTDDQGRIWVLDSTNSRIRLFDKDGGFLGGWGGHGDGKNSFSLPEALAISKGNLYVADTWNHRASRYSFNGEFKGSVTGFMGPRGIAAGADGSVWVADTGNSRVVRYGADLGSPQVVASVGADPGQVKGPVGIAVAPSGNVYVTDPGNKRVQVLDKNGKYVSSISIPWLGDGWQARVEVDKNGTVYLSNPGQSQIESFDRSGKPARKWTTDDAGEKFVRPIGLALDPRQNVLFVMDTASQKVMKISLSAQKGG